MKHLFAISLICIMPMVQFSAIAAEEVPSFSLTIAKHQFAPTTITIPANTKVKLVIRNTDATAEEFECEKLRREKVIPAGGEAVVYVGPLVAGTYPFVGEFHEETAKGELIVK